MKTEDWAIAAVIGAGVFAWTLTHARKTAKQDLNYVPTGFTWDQQVGAYTRVGIDGMTYAHYV